MPQLGEVAAHQGEVVPGVQLARRGSCGCIVVILEPLRNSAGEPSQLPMRQMGAWELGSPVMVKLFKATVPPAVTVTLRVSTTSSFL